MESDSSPDPEPPRYDPNLVYLQHIHPDLTEEGLACFCQQYGNTKNVKKFSMLTAMVWFSSPTDAARAIACINKGIGNNLKITASQGRYKQRDASSNSSREDGVTEDGSTSSVIPVYLSNIDPSYSDRQLYTICQSYGTLSNIKKCSQSTALVWFESNVVAESAISQINDNTSGIRACWTKRKSLLEEDFNYPLYLSNINPQSTEMDIFNFCKNYGQPTSVTKYPENAMVWFKTRDIADDAIRKINAGVNNNVGIVAVVGKRKQDIILSDQDTCVRLTNVNVTCTQNELFAFCQKYGQPTEAKLHALTSAMVVFKTREESAEFMRNINQGNPMDIVATPAKPTSQSGAVHTNASVILSNIDPMFVDEEIQQLCEIYGKAIHFEKTTASTAVVGYEFFNDAEHAIRQLNKGNILGIKANLKVVPNKVESWTENVESKPTTNIASAPTVDWSQRRIRGPFKGPSNVSLDELLSPGEPMSERTSNVIDANDSEKKNFVENMVKMSESSGGEHTKEVYTFCTAEMEELSSICPIDKCAACQLNTDKQCECCRAPYCSVACLKSSWSTHRLTCGSKTQTIGNAQDEPLRNAEVTILNPNESGELAIYKPPTSKSLVIITHVVNHRVLFVRSAEEEAHHDYIRTQMDCAEYNKSATHVNKPPKKYEIVLVQYEENAHRALVLGVISPQEIQVELIDYGLIKTVTLEHVKPLSIELQLRPRHTILVTLDRLPSQLCNNLVLSELYNLMIGYKNIKMVFNEPLNSTSVVMLYDANNGECINEKLVALNQIEPVSLNERPMGMTDLPYTPLDGKDIEIVVLDNSLMSMNSLFCVRKEHLSELIENNKRLQEYGNRVKDGYTPRIHEVVLCEWQHVWYRAVCIEVAGDTMPAFQFIDYGNYQVVNIRAVRKMPREFAYRRVSVECALAGIDEIPTAAIDVLTEVFATNAVVRIDRAENVKSNNEEFSYIHSARVLEMLAKKKLLG